jgi:hypothetical protein
MIWECLLAMPIGTALACGYMGLCSVAGLFATPGRHRRKRSRKT